MVSASSSLAFLPTDAEFADAVRRSADHPEMHGHLLGFVSDVPAALIWSFAKEHALDDGVLLSLCDILDDAYGPNCDRLRRLLAGG